MRGEIALPLGLPGSGRRRYAAAMLLHREGRLDDATLEAFRACALLDHEDPEGWLGRPVAIREAPMTRPDRTVARIHEAPFRPFVYPDGTALGDEVLQLDDAKPLGEGFHVYRMPPGMTTRAHRHNGPEQFLILEGELVESDGTVLRAGDLVLYADGSEHSSHTPNGCLLAVHIAGPEFPA